MSDYTGGYTCTFCGAWVGANGVHSCSGSNVNYPIQRVSEFAQIMAKLDEILLELRRRP